MTKIKRPTIGVLYKNQGESLSYCPECIKVGIKEKMQERIYPEGYPSGDAEYWRQCSRCGNLKETRNLKHEGRLKSELTIQQNPFDRGHTVTIPNNRVGKNQRGNKKGEWDYVADPDLKQELKHGGQLISYSES